MESVLKIYRPTTPSRRKASVIKGPKKIKPLKSLTVPKKGSVGRSQGKISIRHRGGGAKQLYRIIDFKQNKFDIPAKVLAIEYDPNRTSYIARVEYADKEKRYVLAQKELKIGDEILSSLSKIEPKTGFRMPLKYIPLNFPISNIELHPGQGGKMIRSAGSEASLIGAEGGWMQIKLASGEIRKISENCLATIGGVSKPKWGLIRWGKAGRMRHRGIRPSVRGKVMSPRDHPHGGGEGGCPIGLVHPKTPWGKPALGPKTRNKKKWSNKFIIKRRK